MRQQSQHERDAALQRLKAHFDTEIRAMGPVLVRAKLPGLSGWRRGLALRYLNEVERTEHEALAREINRLGRAEDREEDLRRLARQNTALSRWSLLVAVLALIVAAVAMLTSLGGDV